MQVLTYTNEMNQTEKKIFTSARSLERFIDNYHNCNRFWNNESNCGYDVNKSKKFDRFIHWIYGMLF